MVSRRQTIMNTVADVVSCLLYYDRKEDESLPRVAIEEAIRAGEISEAEIIEHFGRKLREGLEL